MLIFASSHLSPTRMDSFLVPTGSEYLFILSSEWTAARMTGMPESGPSGPNPKTLNRFRCQTAVQKPTLLGPATRSIERGDLQLGVGLWRGGGARCPAAPGPGERQREADAVVGRCDAGHGSGCLVRDAVLSQPVSTLFSKIYRESTGILEFLRPACASRVLATPQNSALPKPNSLLAKQGKFIGETAMQIARISESL